MAQIYELTMNFVKAHAALAPFVACALAFGESLAFISLLVPATVLLVGGGGLLGAAGIGFWPVWLGAAIGAALGDWVSYWLGYHYKEAIGNLWPLSRKPELLSQGHAFFEKWGVASVVIGRFFGPLRCVVPLVAGVCAMPFAVFQAANVISAALWAAVVLAPGHLLVQSFIN